MRHQPGNARFSCTRPALDREAVESGSPRSDVIYHMAAMGVDHYVGDPYSP